MIGLLNAIVLGASLSFLGGLVLVVIGRWLERQDPRSGVDLWRTARLASIIPLIIAPIIYFIPQAAPDVGLSNPPVASLAVTSAPPASSGFELPDVSLMLGLLYLMGLSASVAFALLRHLQRSQLVSRGQDGGVVELDALTGRSDGEFALKAPLLISEATKTPILTGWNGVVVAPGQIFDDPEVARYALVHELVHLRRGDERDRLIGVALTTVFWFHWPLREIEKHLDAAREIACDAEVLELLGGGARKPYAAALITMMRGGHAPASAFGSKNRRHREMRIKSILSSNDGQRSPKRAMTAVLLLSWLPVACAQAMATERVAAGHDVHFVSRDGHSIVHERSENIEIRSVEGEDGEMRFEVVVDGDGTPEELAARRAEILQQLESGGGSFEMFFSDGALVRELHTGDETDLDLRMVMTHDIIVDGETDEDVEVFVRRLEEGGNMVFFGDGDVEVIERLEADGENVFVLEFEGDADAHARSWSSSDGGNFEIIVREASDAPRVMEFTSEDGREFEVIVNGEAQAPRVLEWTTETGGTAEVRIVREIESEGAEPGETRVLREVHVRRAPAPETAEEPGDEPNKAAAPSAPEPR